MPFNQFNPSIILLMPVLMLLLIAGLLFFGIRRSHGLVRLLRGAFGVGLLLFAMAIGGFALTLHNYLRIADDVAVAKLSMKQLGPQHFEITLAPTAGITRKLELYGDQWEVDARVVRWKPMCDGAHKKL